MKGLLFFIALLSVGCRETTRVHQRRTMANLRTVGTLLESYEKDSGEYPTVSKATELPKILIPKYMSDGGGYVGAEGAFIDDWERNLRYECWKEASDAAGCDHYAIASAGDDGKFDPQPLRTLSERAFSDANDDIVYRDGKFVRYPGFMHPE